MRTIVPLALYIVNDLKELGEATQEFAQSILVDVTDNDVLLQDYTLMQPPRNILEYPALIAFSGNRGDDYVQLSHVALKELQNAN